jgi:hypothetical protein
MQSASHVVRGLRGHIEIFWKTPKNLAGSYTSCTDNLALLKPNLWTRIHALQSYFTAASRVRSSNLHRAPPTISLLEHRQESGKQEIQGSINKGHVDCHDEDDGLEEEDFQGTLDGAVDPVGEGSWIVDGGSV